MGDNLLKNFISGIVSGVLISIGGTVYLSTDNKIAGALLFTVGLFTICSFGFNLYTGKVCYSIEQDNEYRKLLPVIWLGNFAGCVLTALVLSVTRIGPELKERAIAVTDLKESGSLLSVFILAIFCNILIYIAVEGYRSIPHELGKYLALVFGVVVFILSGFEHCVANMFYFAMAGKFSLSMLVFIIVNTLGNSVGGILANRVKIYVSK